MLQAQQNPQHYMQVDQQYQPDDHYERVQAPDEYRGPRNEGMTQEQYL